MPDPKQNAETPGSEIASKRPTPEAERALTEAEARRRARAAEAPPAAEIGGRDGPDPARYGDWEKGGIVSDF